MKSIVISIQTYWWIAVY